LITVRAYQGKLLILFLTCSVLSAFAGPGRTGGFIQNAGQIHDGAAGARPDVTHVLQTPGMAVLLRTTGFSYQLQRVERNDPDDGRYRLVHHRIDVELPGMSAPQVVQGETMYRNTYHLAGKPPLHAEVVDFVRFNGVYEGVDLVFQSGPQGFKYDIVCRDADALARLRLQYHGTLGPLEQLAHGPLLLRTSLGDLHEHVPASYFLAPHGMQDAQVHTVVDPLRGEVSFTLDGDWLEGTPLVIDPMPQLLWATYLGGEGYDLITQVEVDEEGAAYVTGYTDSAENIATAGAFQGTILGFQNCFLMKYDASGAKEFGTYFGGNQVDRCYGMVREPASGHLYLSGSSFSPGVATPGTHQTTLASLDDGLLVRFDEQGQLVWATYYGGNDHDFIASLDIDIDGNVVLTGHTRSSVGIATDGTLLPGGENCMVARFNPQGQLLWGTYLGGVYDQGWGIGADGAGNVYVTGVTGSSTGISTAGSHQPVYGGLYDAFLVKYGPDGEVLWGTYHGGASRDIGNALVVCADGSIVIVGDTESPTGMSLPGAFQLAPASVDDGFMARFSPEGTLLQATYLGGTAVDYLKAVVEQDDGGLLIAGQSQSPAGLTSPNAFQPDPAGEYDALLLRLSPEGMLDWGTYLGGPLSDLANDVAIDPSTGHALLVGMTRSASGVATPGAHDTVWAGGIFDGFLARLCVPPPVQIIASNGLLLCGEGSLVFDLDQAYPEVIWSNGSDQPSIELFPGDGGTVLVYATAVDASGCTAYSDTLVATFAGLYTPDLEILADASNPVCIGDVLGLSLSVGVSSQQWWNGDTAATTSVLVADSAAAWYGVTVFSAEGCAYTDSVLVWGEICKGVADIDAIQGPSVFPNPAHGLLELQWPAFEGHLLEIEVLAMDGRLLHRGAVHEGRPFKAAWPAGPCVLRVGPAQGDLRMAVRFLLLSGAAP
jgi:hypothetical protein